MGRLLATRIDVTAEMTLIRRLVGTETRVAIETIEGGLDGQSGHGRFETGYARYHVFGYGGKTAGGIGVAVTVFGKPLTVVVGSHIGQETEYFFHHAYF